MIAALLFIAFCIGLIWLCLRDPLMRKAVLIFVAIVVGLVVAFAAILARANELTNTQAAFNACTAIGVEFIPDCMHDAGYAFCDKCRMFTGKFANGPGNKFCKDIPSAPYDLAQCWVPVPKARHP